MASTAPQPRGALLLGSVPLDSSDDVFRTVGSLLGAWLGRIPDGETGVRRNWISWQRPLFEATSLLEPVPPDSTDQTLRRGQSNAYAAQRASPLRLRSGITEDQVVFGPLGYVDAAINSYALFARLKREGVIPSHCRFQVSLPTPLAPLVAFLTPEARAAFEPAYETRLLAELDEMVATIPQDQLAIQWDTAVEFRILEDVDPATFDNPRAAIVERLVHLGERVPAGVELGYHMCYGDAGHRHFKEPADTSLLVDIANAVSAGISRSVTWVHMPVPHNRDDDAYFAPLRNLQLQSDSELYLGLVHQTGGAEGTRRRIAAAQQVVANFGVATECGLGRRPQDTIPDLLRQHAEVSAPLISPHWAEKND